jgi:hypothetical protein
MSLLIQKRREKSMFFAPSYFEYICDSSASDFDPMGVGRGPDSSSIATWGKTGTIYNSSPAV